ncbi:extracellular solute-binding protein [Siccirubricoccus sp. KC 17139]|uniref:Extracellular solute-binding protein n=1 Tax=Siccirubricoccus soli TaxID=2899147 RepID=A0ABT1CY56_9PROT|nr:extracellular solute-binding protein [Siccirubricoccus soli]MCP2680726.1 extracellular solute-binding protein [Siccirubricoccus soli]
MRRRDLALAVAALTAGAPRLPRAQGAQLVVGTWGGDYGEILRQAVDEPVARPAGLEPVQDVAPAPPRKAKLLAERQARRGSMDVAALSDVDMYELAQHGMFDPVPESVRRQAAIIPALRKPYALPHIYSARVILYNPNRVPVAPRSYADLWDPKYRGRIGLSDLLYAQYVETAAIVGGGGNSDFAPAWEKLREWKRLGARVSPSNEALAAALKSEEVWLTVMWLARGFMWKKSGIPLAHVVPSEGATSITYEMAVPRNARNKDQAWRYMDAMLDVRAQAAFADRMGYVPTVTDAPLPAELAREISLSAEDQAKLRAPDYGYMAGMAPQVLEFWNKEFKG